MRHQIIVIKRVWHHGGAWSFEMDQWCYGLKMGYCYGTVGYLVDKEAL